MTATVTSGINDLLGTSSNVLIFDIDLTKKNNYSPTVLKSSGSAFENFVRFEGMSAFGAIARTLFDHFFNVASKCGWNLRES